MIVYDPGNGVFPLKWYGWASALTVYDWCLSISEPKLLMSMILFCFRVKTVKCLTFIEVS